MAYTQLDIINMALGRIGVDRISDLYPTDPSPQAYHADLVWQYVLDEVLEAHDWKFATTRAWLGEGTETEQDYTITYAYRYELPGDFLRLCAPKKVGAKVEYPVYPSGRDYLIETVDISGETLKVILMDYDNSGEDLYVRYIRAITDVTLFTAAFINALAWRLAAELSIYLTEGRDKFEWATNIYEMRALPRAKSVDLASDYIEDEVESTSWVNAGRSAV